VVSKWVRPKKKRRQFRNLDFLPIGELSRKTRTADLIEPKFLAFLAFLELIRQKHNSILYILFHWRFFLESGIWKISVLRRFLGVKFFNYF